MTYAVVSLSKRGEVIRAKSRSRPDNYNPISTCERVSTRYRPCSEPLKLDLVFTYEEEMISEIRTDPGAGKT